YAGPTGQYNFFGPAPSACSRFLDYFALSAQLFLCVLPISVVKIKTIGTEVTELSSSPGGRRGRFAFRPVPWKPDTPSWPLRQISETSRRRYSESVPRY